MPSLLTYTTNLKSYKFGVAPVSDRPGGGNSKQPYITTPIPPQDQQLPNDDLASSDFFIRGGINSARDTADDLIRLFKYFTDFRSVSGPLFVAKQNSLSSIAVKTQATGRGTGLGLNEGVYTPLSTLAQAGINFIGGHVDKQGINPIRGVTTYSDVNQIVIGEPNGEGNRLVDLTTEHEGRNSGVNVLSYSGGPNSILGAFKTNIKFATDNKGATLKVLGNEELTESYVKNQTGLGGSDTDRENLVEDKFRSPLGASLKYTQNNNGTVIIEDGTAEAFIIGGDNEGTLASLNAENGITWINTDGSIPTPKLNNPTELFVIPGLLSGNDIVNKYRNQTGELINSNLTSDDGISWRENLTNPYATGVKGTLATKKFVPRDFKIANPTELFLYSEPEDLKTATGTYMFASGEYVIDDGITDNDGISWRSNLLNPYATGTKGTLASKTYIPRNNRTPNPTDEFIYPTGSVDYSSLLDTPINSKVDSTNGKTWEYQDFKTSVYQSGSLESTDIVKNPANQNSATQTTEELNASANAISSNSTLTDTIDFRNPLRSRPGASKIMSLAPSYISSNNKTIDGFNGSRIKYTSPGQRGKNLTSYTNGSGIGPIDKLNSHVIYKSENADPALLEGDLIPFVIGAIDQNNPNEIEWIHFRAYIDNFSDAYNSNWDEQKYMGRGESFYKYGGFTRKISLGFTVAAQSKEELLQQYKKLNFLASNLAPTYSDYGYMGGPLITLTMGGWCSNLTGFVDSLSLDVPEESPWEIGIDDSGELSTIGGGGASQLPHIVRVSGFSFIPIHSFRPEKQKNTFFDAGKTNTSFPKIDNYGDQHYIHLAEPGTNVKALSTLYNQFMNNEEVR